MENFSWAVLFGGLAFFFFGLENARNGLKLIAGDKLRRILARLTGNRFTALGVGALVTLILQSSTATTVLLVSFAATGLLTLKQSFGVILGADIGTTFVVVLLSIKKITDYALALVALGFFMEWLAKRKKVQYLGSIILGFGLVFYGMHLMISSMAPLKDSPVVASLFQFLIEHPIYNLLLATAFTCLIHNSAAVIGIAIALAFTGTLSFEGSVPIVLGANLGTCITAFLASLKMGVDGKRVAVAHVMIKVVGVVIAIPLIQEIVYGINRFWGVLAKFLPMLNNDISGKIAATHLLFNLAIAILFLPLIGAGVSLVKKLIPRPPSEKEVFGPKYLDERALETPAYALSLVKREIIRLAELVYKTYSNSIRMFENRMEITMVIDSVSIDDDKIDKLDKAIRFYLAKLIQEKLSGEQSTMQIQLLSITTDLEDVGDIISKDLATLAQKRKSRASLFSAEGWADITRMHKLVKENFDLMLSILVSPSKELEKTLERHEANMLNIEDDLRRAHLTRLHEGIKDAFDTSSIHLDILGNYGRINSKLTHIARRAINSQQ